MTKKPKRLPKCQNKDIYSNPLEECGKSMRKYACLKKKNVRSGASRVKMAKEKVSNN